MADDGTRVGTGYIDVKPRLDNSSFKNIANQGTPDGSSYGDKFSKSAQSAVSAGSVAIGNILADLATAAAQQLGQLFGDMLSNYANYEQLIGGVDTLFKESSAIVVANAQDAYKTAGMSANQYMETVTSFSASLLQGLGGDTEAAAAYADMAIRDMSDNANKMGTSMELIQNAYQGFAKDNYTMLDNLSIAGALAA